jgi:signal transduction histidine kinase
VTRLSTVRAQLTLWNLGVMLVVLVVYAIVVYVVVARGASRALDERVRSDFAWAAEMWEQRPDGTITWFDGEPGQESPWLTVWSPEQGIVFQTLAARLYPIEAAGRLAAEADGRIVEVDGHGTTFRVLSGRVTAGDRSLIIQVAGSEALMRLELRELALILLTGLPLAVLVAGIAGYAMARHALTPVEHLAERARSITADRLHERLPVGNTRDEFGRLAAVFNDTLSRLESAFSEMRRFTADVSHELRTPLTVIRSVGEVGLRERRDAAAYREVIGSMLEEADRLTCLVERLLELSRASSGQGQVSIEAIDLVELASSVAAHLSVLADEKRQTIRLDAAGHPRGWGDAMLIRQALTNLLDNAIKYGPEDSQISLRIVATTTHVVIDISDPGPGIARARAAHLFQRFSPGGSATGIGLGLSIARWAVEASGGQLELLESDGGGCTFRLSLRRAAIAAKVDVVSLAG